MVLMANIVDTTNNDDLCLSMLLSYVFSLCCLLSNQTDVELDPVEDSLRDHLQSFGMDTRISCVLAVSL